MAQLGSALEWGSRGRGFNSLHPDQYTIFIYSNIFYTIELLNAVIKFANNSRLSIIIVRRLLFNKINMVLKAE